MIIGILGAAGATGQQIVRQALAAGHRVRALARRPLDISNANLELLIGDATDATSIARLAEGCDVVVSALGPSKRDRDVCGSAARHVIAAGVKRYVSVSGAGLELTGDRRGLGGRAISWLIKRMVPFVYDDKANEYAILKDSGTAWTLVRPPRLVDGEGSGHPRVGIDRLPGFTIARADVARFVLNCCADNSYVRQAPFIAA